MFLNTLQEHPKIVTNATLSKVSDILPQWWSMRNLITVILIDFDAISTYKIAFLPTGGGNHVTFLFTFGNSLNITMKQPTPWQPVSRIKYQMTS